MKKFKRAWLPGKKKLLYRALNATGFFHQRMGSERLLILNYHRIRSNEPQNYPFDEGVYGPTQAQFHEHVRILKKKMTFLEESELIDLITSGKKVPKRSVMITFDDAYRDNYTRALPILRDEKVPASFFVPTQAIENRKLLWWDILAYAIKYTKKKSVHLCAGSFRLAEESGAVINYILQYASRLSSADAEGFVEEVLWECEVEAPSRQECDPELMSWDQIREASHSGISIGSHTHSHRVLSKLSLDEQEYELRLSKSILEEKLGKKVRAIAYPVGSYEHIHDQTAQISERCGYEVGFSFQTGLNPTRLNRYDVRRICPPTCIDEYLATLLAPRIFVTHPVSYPVPESFVAEAVADGLSA